MDSFKPFFLRYLILCNSHNIKETRHIPLCAPKNRENNNRRPAETGNPSYLSRSETDQAIS